MCNLKFFIFQTPLKYISELLNVSASDRKFAFQVLLLFKSQKGLSFTLDHNEHSAFTSEIPSAKKLPRMSSGLALPYRQSSLSDIFSLLELFPWIAIDDITTSTRVEIHQNIPYSTNICGNCLVILSTADCKCFL